MKTAEQKNTSVASIQKSGKPFFSKEGEGNFFGDQSSMQSDFFKPSSAISVSGTGVLQTKLTIGQPDDQYEQEADSMADKVVQRLATPEPLAKVEPAIQPKPLVNFISPVVQAKCAGCEQEEKLQKQEEELTQEPMVELQRKPVFESNGEPPD